MSKLFDSGAIEEIRKNRKQWFKDVYQKKKERQTGFETLSGIPIEPLYTPEHVADLDYMNALGLPGQSPYTRGVHANMYRGRTWTIRQLAGFGPPEETNLRYKLLLDEGASGINAVFDYPTLRGYDSTDPLVRADVGRGGVAVDTLQDMQLLFDGIALENTSASLVTCNPSCNVIIQSMYFANALRNGLRLNQLFGTSQNDFLMETAITAAPEVLPPKISFKLCCDAIEYCTRYVPRWNPISFTGYNYREAGCDAPQEVAFVIANAIACTEEMIRRGHAVDSFAPRLSFFLSGHSDFFEEIAKYRAARRIWYRVMQDRFGAQEPRSMTFRFHVQTAGIALTAQQPLNNISRAAYHGLSAVLGGAQSVHIDAYDEALCTPTELSALTALRTSQILQLETGVTSTVDPLGGSYFVESLTNQMETKIIGLLEKIDQIGGIVKAVETGWFHQEISNSAYAHQQAIEKGELPIVGVNCFRDENEELPMDLFEVPETLNIQKEKLERIKKERSASRVQAALDAVRSGCDENGNMMEIMVEAVGALVTEGELSKVLKESFGTWNPPLF